jgi:hypothetical protein
MLSFSLLSTLRLFDDDTLNTTEFAEELLDIVFVKREGIGDGNSQNAKLFLCGA